MSDKQLVRLILPKWAYDSRPKVIEGEFTFDEIDAYNTQSYNVYYLPNSPSHYELTSKPVDGSRIDNFQYVFVDMDEKDGVHTKESFVDLLYQGPYPNPSRIVDSGGGIHAYWKVSDLDAMSYLRLSRRFMRLLNTDEAVGQIFQLMRLPNTANTKIEGQPRLCETLSETDSAYTCEALDAVLPPIALADETYCKQHYEKTYRIKTDIKVDMTLPLKFSQMLSTSREAVEIWKGNTSDRSASDYRLGHLMLAHGFSKIEAMSVLVNSPKALNRAPQHQVSYAENIVDKIWTYEATGVKEGLSISVEDLLSKGSSESLKGRRFPCTNYFDGTEHGFRLTQVLGLCAGVGVGKTAIGLNLFKGFVEKNPDFVHMFVSLEQPGREIADRWRKMCGTNTALHKKVHVLSNYNEDGSYRNLSLTEIQQYIIEFQKDNKVKVGCVCLDHIGVLRQESRNGEHQGLREICTALKSFAVATETLFVIQSQTNRDKAGDGDLELFKGAAYGTQHFESFVDFLLVAWQPLKRCYDDPGCPRVTAYKFAKVRFKSKRDLLIEDQCYRLFFESDIETLRPMTQMEEKSFDFFASKALNIRKKDRKTDLVPYKSIRWEADSAEENEASRS